jgi:3-oxoacyl-[acyl-carrier-protein] synthase III
MTPTQSFPQLTAIGAYTPERILSNDDLSTMVDTNDEWIVRRTGIKNRRIAAENEFTSDMCVAAANDMMARYSVQLDDVDLVIACTHTPDYPFPSVSCLVQDKLGIQHAGAFDLNASCAGFTYGLHVASGLVASGMHKKILIVAGDTMSKVVDYSDRSTCILFGDGAAAVLIEAADQSAFLSFELSSDGSGGKHVYRAGLSTVMDGTPLEGSGYVVQNGREVYRFAVSVVPDAMNNIARQAGLSLEQVDWFIPHSANLRMIESICERSGFPIEKTLYSLVDYGNTSAASIPLSLILGLDEGKVNKGDLILLYGFGGGLVHGGLLLRWMA